MRRCCSCGELWGWNDRGEDVKCRCRRHSRPREAPERPPSRHPDETGCPPELRGLGWLEHDDGTTEPAWRAVVEGREWLTPPEVARERLEALQEALRGLWRA